MSITLQPCQHIPKCECPSSKSLLSLGSACVVNMSTAEIVICANTQKSAPGQKTSRVGRSDADQVSSKQTSTSATIQKKNKKKQTTLQTPSDNLYIRLARPGFDTIYAAVSPSTPFRRLARSRRRSTALHMPCAVLSDRSSGKIVHTHTYTQYGRRYSVNTHRSALHTSGFDAHQQTHCVRMSICDRVSVCVFVCGGNLNSESHSVSACVHLATKSPRLTVVHA